MQSVRKLAFLVILGTLACPLWAAVAHDGNCAATATSCTFSATATGDMKIVFAYVNNSVTIPSLPAGWTTIDSGATAATGVTAAFRIGCNVSSSSGDTGTGTWTGATMVSAISYSGTSVLTTGNCNFTGVGATAKNNAKTSTTLNYPAIGSPHQATGTSWFAGFAGASAGAACTPTGMTSVASNGAGPAVAVADTNAGAASWSSTNCTVTSGTWMSSVLEIAQASCKNTAYAGTNFTCKQSTAISIPGACGTQTGAITVQTAGDLLFIYLDADAAITGMSDQVNGAWTAQTANSNWQGTSNDRFYTVIASTAVSLNITPVCSGSTSFEYVITEFHSSVGTVAVDCIASLVIVNPSGSPPAPSCTATKTNDLGWAWIDWNNGVTSGGSGWSIIQENAETIQEIKALGAPALMTATWVAGSDNYLGGAIAFSDGASVAAKPNSHGSTL